MKAIANTTLQLGPLINIPVQLAKATDSGTDVQFKQAGPSGESLRQAYLLPNGEECPKDEIQKGIFSGSEFCPISEQDIAAIKEATKLPDLKVTDVIDVGEFWAQAHRITGMYYVQMNNKLGSANTMKLFIDALDAEGKALVTKWTPRSRQELLVLWPMPLPNGDKVLCASSLAFERDVREADETVRGHLSGAYSEQEMGMARQLLTALADTKADTLAMEVDEALPMKNKLVEDALAGKGILVPAETAAAAPTKNAALADALAQALEAAGAKVAA